jgi:peptide/nickel transport system permease protein
MRDQALSPLAGGLARPGTAPRGLRSVIAFSRKRPSFLVGLVIVVVTLFLAVFGPLIAPYHPERALPGAGLLPPSPEHWMGTDVAGMDIFSRIISAPRIDLTIALVSSLIAFVLGVVLGVISGFFAGAPGLGRFLSEGFMRSADILQAFPIFIFALALVGFRVRASRTSSPRSPSSTSPTSCA